MVAFQDSRSNLLRSALFAAAVLLFVLGSPAQSKREELSNVQPEVVLQRAMVCKQHRRYEAAIRLFSKYLESVSENADAHASLSFCQNGVCKYSDALVSSERALVLAPKNVEALSNRAWALNHLHRYSEALETCERALEVNPEDPESWCEKGEALLKLGDAAGALAAFNKHCDLHPDEPYGYECRAAAYKELGRPDLAKKDLDKLLD